jgi:kumamolisin
MSFLKRHTPMTTRIRRPHAAASGYKAMDVAKAYNLPAGDGSGVTIGIIELGGAYSAADMASMGLNAANVTTVNVAGGKPVSDGPNGADGEVMLDVEVCSQIAPAAKIRVYFASNTDAGFEQAVAQAATECDVISISWGGPDSSWAQASITAFSAIFASARAKGIPVFAASGDSGSTDGTRSNVTDYPASDPNVIGCGGTRLVLNPDGSRASEVAWNDNPTQSASGGGISKVFPGRNVPDVAGNADPVTGYLVTVDAQSGVIGGTSAVAPLYAACYAVIKQLYGKPFDFLNTVTSNPTAFFDVTSGNNGSYRAGPGRDEVTGLGALDFGKLLAILTSGTQIPAPGGGTPTPTPTPTPAPAPTPTPAPDPDAKFETWLRQYQTFNVKANAYMDQWLKSHGH